MAAKIFYTKVDALEENDLFERGLSLVQQERKSKVLACRMQADQRRSLAAGLLIRYACERLGYDYRDMAFYREDGGRPYAQSFLFNVSHAGSIAAIAAGDVRAGIDVEWGGRFDGERGIKQLKAIAPKIFDEQEKERVMSASGGEFTARARIEAVRIWTCKESYAKAQGSGLGMDFSKIHTCAGGGWTSYEIEDGYLMSIYVREPGKIENPVCVRMEEMIR